MRRIIPRKSKPNYPVPIHWANPLTNGLIFSSYFLPSRVYDFVGGAHATLGAATTFRADRSGVGLYSDETDATQYAEWANADVPTITKEHTVQLTFSPNFDSTDVGGVNFNTFLDQTDDNTAGIRVFWTSAAEWRYRLFTTAGAVNLDHGGNGFNIGDTITLIMQYDGANMRLYENGLLLNSAAKTGDFSNSSDDWIFGNTNNTPTVSESANCIQHIANFWNRSITEAEVREISQNPYQILQPRTQYVGVEVVAAAGRINSLAYKGGLAGHGGIAGHGGGLAG